MLGKQGRGHCRWREEHVWKPESLAQLENSKLGLPWGLSGKEFACDAGDTGGAGSIPGLGRFPGGGYGNPLQYPCLENPMDRGAWCAAVHVVAKSWT